MKPICLAGDEINMLDKYEQQQLNKSVAKWAGFPVQNFSLESSMFAAIAHPELILEDRPASNNTCRVLCVTAWADCRPGNTEVK